MCHPRQNCLWLLTCFVRARLLSEDEAVPGLFCVDVGRGGIPDGSGGMISPTGAGAPIRSRRARPRPTHLHALRPSLEPVPGAWFDADVRLGSSVDPIPLASGALGRRRIGCTQGPHRLHGAGSTQRRLLAAQIDLCAIDRNEAPVLAHTTARATPPYRPNCIQISWRRVTCFEYSHTSHGSGGPKAYWLAIEGIFSDHVKRVMVGRVFINEKHILLEIEVYDDPAGPNPWPRLRTPKQVMTKTKARRYAEACRRPRLGGCRALQAIGVQLEASVRAATSPFRTG